MNEYSIEEYKNFIESEGLTKKFEDWCKANKETEDMSGPSEGEIEEENMPMKGKMPMKKDGIAIVLSK